ncbi:aspartate aminotransferase family protein [Variovorax sp. NFACC27]|uniref:aspartate aminotransferase family protein n=1 Tax=unclassified Variovorax TaxID=663243 RepID=UPI00089992E7|nr:2,2-dialkylglycine decarboxylase (pyruvate) [Variovorax sp. NFACC28]SEG00717.1 2,2-dialkylglycine decarboxylase (pyruvate) [Variovorax sp. NFACC29]SFB95840.1 2,2-dialkylglycine decarboxylase (pyruvate) [Variovorax sp. NFACC26]SFF80816.1 2,2-dialkylglycine decarboxylase (pyruvate) [Variovorax sp. NFACC27]
MAEGATYDPVASRHLVRYGMGLSPHVIVKARGATLWDQQGREILDFTSGQMCATIGHNHPRIVAAIQKACEGALHLYSGFVGPAVPALAGRLASMLPPSLSKSIFLSTGGEANEAAVRMARVTTGRYEIVGLNGGWHGVTGGIASLTFAGRHHVDYGPRKPGTMSIPAPNCYRCPVRHCRDACDTTCLDVGFDMVDAQSSGSLAAFIAEPVLSSGGVIVPPRGYFPKLKEKCRERGMLLILDEAQTAFGRMGANFAFEQADVVPDILTVSKTLGGGVAIGAAITSEAIEQDCHDKGFVHVTSHVSDPLPAEVALAVLDVLEEEDLARRAAEMGKRLRAGLETLKARHEVIGDVRGHGLLQGVELVKDRETREPDAERGRAITDACMERGLSMNIVAVGGMAAVWRIAPPLNVSAEELDRGLEILDDAIRSVS